MTRRWRDECRLVAWIRAGPIRLFSWSTCLAACNQEHTLTRPFQVGAMTKSPRPSRSATHTHTRNPLDLHHIRTGACGQPSPQRPSIPVDASRTPQPRVGLQRLGLQPHLHPSCSLKRAIAGARRAGASDVGGRTGLRGVPLTVARCSPRTPVLRTRKFWGLRKLQPFPSEMQTTGCACPSVLSKDEAEKQFASAVNNPPTTHIGLLASRNTRN